MMLKKRTYKYIIVNRKNFGIDKNRAWLVKKIKYTLYEESY